jgi:hypothetical protein
MHQKTAIRSQLLSRYFVQRIALGAPLASLPAHLDATMEGALGRTDVRVLKRDEFRAVFDTEEHYLQDEDLTAQMKSEVSKL